MEIKKVALIGLGAIGCGYGQKLFHGLNDGFTAVAKGERLKRLKDQGCVINSQRVFFPVISPEDKSFGEADLIIFAVKFSGLREAIGDVKNLVGPNTYLMSILNGITSDELIAEAYGSKSIIYSKAMGIDSTRENGEVKLTTVGHIRFGRANNKILSPEVEAIAQMLKRCDIPYQIPEDMIRAMWFKFMLNVGLNQITAITRATYQDYKDIKEIYNLGLDAMDEVIEISKAVHVDLSRSDISEIDKLLDTMKPEGKTSMLQDVEADRVTEVEIFSGAVMELGKKYGIKTPVNDMLYRIITAIDKKNASANVIIK